MSIRFGVHQHSRLKFRRTLKQITCRSNGKGYSWLKRRLTSYIRGWLYYYRLCDMKDFIIRTDKWYHRRLRMYIWKSWKRAETRCLNLQKCGISPSLSWQWSHSRKGYWHLSDSWILHRALPLVALTRAGYPSILDMYTCLHRS